MEIEEIHTEKSRYMGKVFHHFLAIAFVFIFTMTQLAYVEGCPIYLTFSLDGKTVEESFLEINWGPACPERPEWIGLFSKDPKVSPSQPLAKFYDLRNSTGKFNTKVKVGELGFPVGWNRNDHDGILPIQNSPKGHCLPFYAASFNGEKILLVDCLKIQPNWMQKLDHVSSLPLKDLLIPGSHASGAFSSKSTQPKSLLIKNYALTQHLDVWSQLVFGIRFIDLSIGYQNTENNQPPSADNFWIVNENIFLIRLLPILKDVKRFIELSQEVVILDFSSFPIGFSQQPERHSDLLSIIKAEIGDIVYRPLKGKNDNRNCDKLSVNDIRRTGKNLLILYPHDEISNLGNVVIPESEIICPTWKHFTTSNINMMETLDFMRLLFSKKETTPVRNEGWIFHAVKGLEQSLNSNRKLQTIKERTGIINPKISTWLGGPWSLEANVIVLDYFSNTNLIQIAIYANMHKAFTFANKNLTFFDIDTQHPMEIV